MSLCKLLVILLMLSLLLLFTTIIIKYFNKIEEFTTIYVSNTALSGKYGITCSQCGAGEEPNSDSTACVACQSTHAGTGGTCTECPNGEEPNSDSTECVYCPPGYIGREGSCNTKCPNGRGANSDSTQCWDCPAGMYGTNGICHNCGRGKWQNHTGQSSCNDCPANKGAGPASGRTSSSSCGNCTAPAIQSAAGQACQNCPHGLHWDSSRCYKNSACNQKRAEGDHWHAVYQKSGGQNTNAYYARNQAGQWMAANC